MNKKERVKKILDGFGEVIGYGFAMGYVSVLTYIVYLIHRDGMVCPQEPNKFIRYFEMGAGTGTVAFLLYKALKSMKKRENELSEV